MQMSAGVRRNAVCGPGCGEAVALSEDGISSAIARSGKRITAVIEPIGRSLIDRYGSAQRLGRWQDCAHGHGATAGVVFWRSICLAPRAAPPSARDLDSCRARAGSLSLARCPWPALPPLAAPANALW